MRPVERLRKKLDDALAPHGMRIVGEIGYQQGAQRRMDLCRWFGGVGFRDPAGEINRCAVWSIASWDTITDCLRHGFVLTFRDKRSEADIMVDAKDPT